MENSNVKVKEVSDREFEITITLHALKQAGTNNEYMVVGNLHTGEWPDWDPDMQMPNSAGCMHAHPSDLDSLNQIVMQRLGVQVNPNPFSGKDYPYKPQGIISMPLQRASDMNHKHCPEDEK